MEFYCRVKYMPKSLQEANYKWNYIVFHARYNELTSGQDVRYRRFSLQPSDWVLQKYTLGYIAKLK
jgi:hypothetical protein